MYSPTSKVRTSRSGVALRQSQGDDAAAADDDETPNRVNNNQRTGDDEENENKNKESNNTENDGSTEEQESTAWIQQAMDTTTSNTPTDPPPPLPITTTTMITQSGVAGFAVDSELGFVCLIAHHDDANDDDDDDDRQPQQQQQYVPVVISTLDRTTVQSAEALCLIQLVGGLDLGAVVFPPDILARLVATELEDEDEDEDESAGDNDTSAALVEDLRTRVTLLAVTVVRDNDADDDCVTEEDPLPTTTATPPAPSSPARTANIEKVSTKVLTAVQKLRGLAEVTAEQVVAAMQVHTNAEGMLDRVAFSEVLDTLRRRDSVGGSSGDGNWKFRLTASIDKEGDDCPSTLIDFSATAFESIGLALRYKVKVAVSDDCWREEGSGLTFDGVNQVVERFPYFRPVQELKEDAKIMDGLIPSMFFKEKPPENENKA